MTTLGPGEVSAWHTHPAPLFAYVLEGEMVTVYDGGEEVRLGTGDALMEALDRPHQVTNVGASTAEVLFVLIGNTASPVRINTGPPLSR